MTISRWILLVDHIPFWIRRCDIIRFRIQITESGWTASVFPTLVYGKSCILKKNLIDERCFYCRGKLGSPACFFFQGSALFDYSDIFSLELLMTNENPHDLNVIIRLQIADLIMESRTPSYPNVYRNVRGICTAAVPIQGQTSCWGF